MKRIDTELLSVNGKQRLVLRFSYNQEIIHKIKAIPSAWYESKHKVWHVAFTQGNLNHLASIFGDRDQYLLDLSAIQKHQLKSFSGTISVLKPLDITDKEKLRLFENWMRFRRYSRNTIRTYTELTVTFLRFIKPKNAVSEVGDEVQRFILEYVLPKKLSLSYQNQLINALKLFYTEIVRQELIFSQVQRPRREHKLPNVLSKQEVKKLLGVMKNIKHRAMLSTIYGCGLRRSELLNLKPKDIESNRGIMVIKQAKGKKDRVVPISEKLIELLRQYYLQYRPLMWMFEGVKTGEQYDERSLQQVLKKAIFLTGIKKPVTLHWLRHSYATHLHESGVDIRYIQEILGHSSSKTTGIYTHVSNRSIQQIRSPFDDL